ncbi:HVO_A0114 family putative DNA-binding protein [Endothiovibrio diazotrophicus]
MERDVRRVHDGVGVLLDLGLIEKDDQGKLLCPYADIHVDMHLKAA